MCNIAKTKGCFDLRLRGNFEAGGGRHISHLGVSGRWKRAGVLDQGRNERLVVGERNLDVCG